MLVGSFWNHIFSEMQVSISHYLEYHFVPAIICKRACKLCLYFPHIPPPNYGTGCYSLHSGYPPPFYITPKVFFIFLSEKNKKKKRSFSLTVYHLKKYSQKFTLIQNYYQCKLSRWNNFLNPNNNKRDHFANNTLKNHENCFPLKTRSHPERETCYRK